MSRSLHFLAIVATLATSACVSGPDLSRVSRGMTKQQVVARLGRPLDVSVEGRTEDLIYGWNDSMWDGRVGERHWLVRLVDDRVYSYGPVPLTEAQIHANALEKQAALNAMARAIPQQVNVKADVSGTVRHHHTSY